MADTTRRERVLDEAVRVGKIHASEREAWSKRWDRNPQTTEATIDDLVAVSPELLGPAEQDPGDMDAVRAAFGLPPREQVEVGEMDVIAASYGVEHHEPADLTEAEQIRAAYGLNPDREDS